MIWAILAEKNEDKVYVNPVESLTDLETLITTEITELWNEVKNSYHYHAHKLQCTLAFSRRFKNKSDKQRRRIAVESFEAQILYPKSVQIDKMYAVHSLSFKVSDQRFLG